MKAIYSIILVCFLAVVVTSASAQNRSKDIRKYQAELKLTSQQMQQLNTIYNNHEAKTKLQAPAKNFEQKAAQIKASNKQMRQEVKAVLNKNQKREYRKMMGVKMKTKNKNK